LRELFEQAICGEQPELAFFPFLSGKLKRPMPSRRSQKAAQAIREVVSMAILAELKDPRIQDVTVTYVEVSGDLRHAKVHVSVMGDRSKQQLSLQGLRSAAGFLQSRCASRIDTRYTPRIQFVLDQGVKKSIEISQILAEVLPDEGTSQRTASDAIQPEANPTEPDHVERRPAESAHPPPEDSAPAADHREPAS
jgi:ribosome-binding factor A